MYYYKDFDLVSCQPKRDLYYVDTVTITAKVSLQHISEVLNISADELQFLNPSIKTGIIPLTANGFPMNLPISYIGLFEARRDEIMNDTSLLVQTYQPPVAQKARVFYYKVKNKETLGYIAAKFGVTVNALKHDNKLKSNSVYVGQQLKIVRYTQVPVEDAKYTQVFAVKPIGKGLSPDSAPLVEIDTNASAVDYSDTSNKTIARVTTDTVDTVKSNLAAAQTKLNQQCGCIYFIVQPGDTLWNIAQRYQGLTIDKLKADNQDVLAHPIKPGDVLKIFAQ